jgi:NAD(P)-dependent dehydrogenase (short-subunit alcohol dehydrogenase family)
MFNNYRTAVSKFLFLWLLINSGLIQPLMADTTVLITGANRGIGLDFVRQYAERGYTVIATARKPEKAKALQAMAVSNEKIIIEPLDVTDLEAIDGLAKKYQGQPIDILLNNAGVTGNPQKTQQFGQIDYDAFDRVFHVNVVGPLKMTEAFIEHVAASDMKKIISVSSSMGSIQKSFGGAYFYRASKSALNMVMRSLARDTSLKFKKRGIIIGLVNPGPTDTDMMKALKERGAKLRDSSVATADMIRNIDDLTIKTSGSFLQYDGSVIPW